MRKLSIFDDDVRVATITEIDSSVFLFARSPREWKEIKRLMDATPKGSKYLENLANKAQSYSYSTELVYSDK